MPNLIKEQNGIIYKEEFQENSLIWSLSPSDQDCLRFEPDGLHVLYGKKYICYTMQEPDDPYCLIMQLEHNPVNKNDIGGLIVLSRTDDYVECQTYLADAPSSIQNHASNIKLDLDDIYVRYSFDGQDESGEESDSSFSDDTDEEEEYIGYVDTIYKFIRMIKYNNGMYQFFASSDGEDWIEVGSYTFFQKHAKNSIGIFLYGAKDREILRNGKFVINEFDIYKSPYITINGINMLYDFEIIDNLDNKVVLRSDNPNALINRNVNKVEINTNNVKLPIYNGKLRVYSKLSYDVTIAEYELGECTVGGDIFNINYDIKLFIDGEEVEKATVYDLGTLFIDSFKKNIVIYNNEDIDLDNIKVSIIPYSEYYNGEESVCLSLYKGNLMDTQPLHYEYKDYIIIDRLEAHTGTEVVIKLSEIPKKEFYSVANKYRFKILIE